MYTPTKFDKTALVIITIEIIGSIISFISLSITNDYSFYYI